MKNYIKKISKKLFNTYDPRVFLKRKIRSVYRKLYKEKFNTSDFIKLVSELGINPGDIIFFQTSWDEYYNYTGTPTELIKSLVDYLGPTGTLAMPSNCNIYEDGKTFNVKRTPTNAGLIAELFRRWPQAIRSIHINSSVTALGPKAKYITSTHHKSITAWDEHSPHYKLYQLNAKNLTIGLGKYLAYVTPLHCIDSIMRENNSYFKSLFTKKIQYKWIGVDGNKGSMTIYLRNGQANWNKYSKQVRCVPHKSSKISNLQGYSVSLKPLIDYGLELAKKGVVFYTSPKPYKRFFNSLDS